MVRDCCLLGFVLWKVEVIVWKCCWSIMYFMLSINKMYFIIHFNISLCHKVLFGYAQQPQPQRASNAEAEAQWPGGILLKDLGRNLERDCCCWEKEEQIKCVINLNLECSQKSVQQAIAKMWSSHLWFYKRIKVLLQRIKVHFLEVKTSLHKSLNHKTLNMENPSNNLWQGLSSSAVPVKAS